MKTAARAIRVFSLACLVTPFVRAVDKTTLEEIWDTAILYNTSDRHGLKKFAITGRLHGDYENFDELTKA